MQADSRLDDIDVKYYIHLLKMANSESGDGVQVQHNKPLLRMLFNPIYSDIKLIIGPDGPGQVEFSAHKAILAINSEFFKNMFDHEKESSSFKFPDAEPISFRLFLMYVYSNDFGDLLKEPDIDSNSVALEVLKYAKIYFVEPLVDFLVGHIDKMKTMSNILSIICAYNQLDLKKKKTEVYEFARRNFYRVAQSEEWTHLPRKVVQDFIDDSEITANEMDIIKALKSWGEAQCSNTSNSSNQRKTNILELRQVLEGLVELIRYKRMSSMEFVTHVIPLNILTVEQEHKILVELTLSANDRLPEPVRVSSSNIGQGRIYNAGVSGAHIIHPIIMGRNYYQTAYDGSWMSNSNNDYMSWCYEETEQPSILTTRAADKRIL